MTVSEGTEAVLCDVASCGAALCRVSLDDTSPWDAVLCGVTLCGGLPEGSGPCSAAPCKAQGTSAEVKLEVEGDREAAFLAASVAGEMSGRVSLTVFTGVGNDGSSAPSQSRFLAEYIGGTGMEAAEVWRNSANTSLRILTWVLREASVLLVTGCEQHTG